jgi:hypothetical protein
MTTGENTGTRRLIEKRKWRWYKMVSRKMQQDRRIRERDDL